jgi:Zn-dependent protease with chaperone function
MTCAVDIKFEGRFYDPGLALSTSRWVWLGSKLLAALGALILTFLSAPSFTRYFIFAQTGSQQNREISRVESWFTGKSLAEINSALTRLRPEIVTQSDKAILMRNLPLVNADNRIEDRRQLDTLNARLARTLKFFERDQIVELIIFRHPQPIVYSKPGVVVVISTEILKIVGSDDAALNGVVAHELAHEYVALEILEALQSRSLSRIRELELFCDAVAVVVMLDLQFDPARYARALKRIATHSQKSAKLNNGENSHPAVGSRLRVISDISAMFTTRSPLLK